MNPEMTSHPSSLRLHPKVVEELTAARPDLISQGKLPSDEVLAGLYATFRRKFGPEVLAATDGEELLSLMHETTKDALVYWLEFKDDDEFPAYFGSIAGGSALKYGLYRRRETGVWMTGPPTDQHEISTAQAVAIARRHRDQLLAAHEFVDRLRAESDDLAYSALQADLERVAPDVENSSWGHKYLSLLHPDKLDDFHAASYQRFHLIKMLQQPPGREGRYASAGRFIAASRALGWPVNHLDAPLEK